MPDETLLPSYDVVVIGGGAAGLNGALMLARSRRSVVVIDAGQPRNAPADAVHGLLGHDGVRPSELLERGRWEVRSYGGSVVSGCVDRVLRTDHEFTVRLVDGRSATARRLLVTAGVVDELPALPGLAERWGRDVLHCPYCHGWEVRDQAIGVLASGPLATHQALLFRQLSKDITVFAHTTELIDHDRQRLTARGIRIVAGEVAGVQIDDDRLTAVRMADGTVVPRSVVTVQSVPTARAELLAPLGLQSLVHPMGVGTYVPSDPTGMTTVPGVWVAGNVTDLSAQVGAAAAAGALAGARINADLVDEETESALSQASVTMGR